MLGMHSITAAGCPPLSAKEHALIDQRLPLRRAPTLGGCPNATKIYFSSSVPAGTVDASDPHAPALPLRVLLMGDSALGDEWARQAQAWSGMWTHLTLSPGRVPGEALDARSHDPSATVRPCALDVLSRLTQVAGALPMAGLWSQFTSTPSALRHAAGHFAIVANGRALRALRGHRHRHRQHRRPHSFTIHPARVRH